MLVADRGMLTDTQIETLRQYPGLGWVSALRHHDIRQLAEDNRMPMSLFDTRNRAEIRSPLYSGERLIVCCNLALAERRRNKREVRRRTKKPLLATEIAEKVGRAKQGCKVGKHFQTEIAAGHFEFQRDPHSIEREASLDGQYVIRTSESELQAANVVRSYKQLTRVERARTREGVRDALGHFQRVMERIDPAALERMIQRWTQPLVGQPQALAADGEWIRGANRLTAQGQHWERVTLVAHATGQPLASRSYREEGGEQGALRALLEDLRGKVLTLDAGHAGQEIQRAIIEHTAGRCWCASRATARKPGRR